MINPCTETVIIVQRQTLDWACMTEAEYEAASIPFCRLWERPDDYMITLVRLWNRTFQFDYFSTRQALKTLASDHNNTLPGTQFIAYNGYRNIPYGHMSYTFIDDDDWLSPALGATLSLSRFSKPDACIWKGCTLGSPNSDYPLFFWGLNGRCMTNNYAVSGQWMQDHQHFQQVCKHSLAEQTLPDLKPCLLDEWLSMTNKAPCSSVSLERGLQGELTPGRLAQTIAEYNQRMSTIDEQDFARAPWAWPLHQTTRKVFSQVEASRQA